MRDIHVFPGGGAASIDIGRQGENLACQVVFHLDGWVEDTGAGYAQLLYIRHGDLSPYPCALIQQTGTAAWPVLALDTEKVGTGWCELRYLNGGQLIKSRRYAVTVEPCLNGETPPTPSGIAGTWLEQLLAKEDTARSEARFASEYAELAKAEAEKAEGAATEAGDQAALARQAAEAAAETAAAAAVQDVEGLMSQHVSDAQTAQDAAETAQGQAEAAQGAAETAQSAAETAKADAETAQGLAEAAQAAAEAAQTAAALFALQAASAVSTIAIPFTEEDWSAPDEEGGYYLCRFPNSTHFKTNGDFIFHVYHLVEGRLVSNTWGVAGTDVWYDAVSGDIVLRSRTPYAGKIALL